MVQRVCGGLGHIVPVSGSRFRLWGRLWKPGLKDIRWKIRCLTNSCTRWGQKDSSNKIVDDAERTRWLNKTQDTHA
jgi:hypothetical protein